MGKKLVIIAFLVSFGLAVYVYFSRETRSLRENLGKAGVREPRVVMEDFTLYRYEDDILTSKLTARLGQFFEPNVVELDGEIRGERLSQGERELLGAESATAYFKASKLSTLMQEHAELDRAELTGFVEVGVKDHLLTTDFAEYLNQEQLVRSQRPVRVEGPNRTFMGDEGFTYSVAAQILDMPGPIRGVMALDEKE